MVTSFLKIQNTLRIFLKEVIFCSYNYNFDSKFSDGRILTYKFNDYKKYSSSCSIYIHTHGHLRFKVDIFICNIKQS